MKSRQSDTEMLCMCHLHFRYTVVQERDSHWDAASTNVLRENENLTSE